MIDPECCHFAMAGLPVKPIREKADNFDVIGLNHESSHLVAAD